MMLSFLHRWDYCWKCEFDIDVRIENYNHHDGEQITFFIEKYISKHIKIQSRKENVLVIFVLLQETKNSNLFDKNCIQENVKCHNSGWRKLIWMNHNRTGKLQVTLLSTCIFRKKLCSHTFKAASEELIVMYSENMKEKYMKEDVWKSFFRKVAGWHLATS